MFVNSVYYEETLKSCNNLCNLVKGNNFVQVLSQLYAASAGKSGNFLGLRTKCLKSKKRFIKQVEAAMNKTEYADAIECLLKDFDSWSNLCIKNFTYTYNENLKEFNNKGEENESNLD